MSKLTMLMQVIYNMGLCFQLPWYLSELGLCLPSVSIVVHNGVSCDKSNCGYSSRVQFIKIRL